MNGRGFITISMHELERAKIIEAVVQRPDNDDDARTGQVEDGSGDR